VKLVLVTPQNKHEYVVKWIEVHTASGSLVIQPGHAPMILMLAPGASFSFLSSIDEKVTIPLVRSGFMEVNRDSAVALLGQETDISPASSMGSPIGTK
jgi:F0F1-type ATP synthase epsilon subunit